MRIKCFKSFIVMAELIECFDPFDFKRDFFTRRSREPSLQEMKNAKYIVLAHFTSSVFLEEIKKQGLIPDIFKKRVVQDGLPSDTECVYLSAKLDKFYINRALENHGGTALIVVVKVELTSLEADENTITPSRINNLSPNEILYESLCLGQCKHKGKISQVKFLAFIMKVGLRFGNLPKKMEGVASLLLLSNSKL